MTIADRAYQDYVDLLGGAVDAPLDRLVVALTRGHTATLPRVQKAAIATASHRRVAAGAGVTVVADLRFQAGLLDPLVWNAPPRGLGVTAPWQLIQAARQRPSQSLHVLPTQTMDGHRVDVLELTGVLLLGLETAQRAVSPPVQV